MSRVKRSVVSRARRKKVLKQAKGYYGTRHGLLKTAREAVEKGWKYSYRDRRQRKRQFRSLWIARINAAAAELGELPELDQLRARLQRHRELTETQFAREREALAQPRLEAIDGHLARGEFGEALAILKGVVMSRITTQQANSDNP